MKVYIDRNDWWIGYYRGVTRHYVCLLPTVVVCWRRKCNHENYVAATHLCPDCGKDMW